MIARRRIVTALALVAFAALVACLPLRLAAGWLLDGSGLTARRASGLIWAGYLDSARIGGFDLQTMDLGLEPLPLLIGRARLWFNRPGTDNPGVEPLTGKIVIGWNRRALQDVSGMVRDGAVAGVPVERMSFDRASVAFSDGACTTASGRVTLVPAVRIAGLELRNGLSGDLRCEGRDLIVALAGESGMERLLLTVNGSGGYSARLTVQTSDAALGAGLSAAGFTPMAGGYEQRLRGRF
jgi:general secretion pathway protein N